LKRSGLSELIRKIMVMGGGKPGALRPPTLEIDFDHTKAFSCGYYTGGISINPKLSGEEYKKVQDELVSKLKELRDPRTGKKIVKEVYRKQDLFHGPYTKEAPDVLLVMEDEYWVVGGFNYPWLFEPVIRETGQHRIEGVVIINGPGIRKNFRLKKAYLWDVAPTILHIFNISANMDGRVLQEVFLEKM